MKRIVLAGVALIAVSGCGGLLGGLTGGGQSKACKDYVDCAEKVSPGTRATNETSFGPNGSCWLAMGAAADQCTATCTSGNDAYKANGDAAKFGCTF